MTGSDWVAAMHVPIRVCYDGDDWLAAPVNVDLFDRSLGWTPGTFSDTYHGMIIAIRKEIAEFIAYRRTAYDDV